MKERHSTLFFPNFFTEEHIFKREPRKQGKNMFRSKLKQEDGSTVIIVDIKSKFGAFTRSASNTGGLLTYPLPPKTSIVGMLGAVLGYEFSETVEKLDGIRIGIKPMGDIHTKRMTYTSHYGSRIGRMLNVKQEILIDPEYRIYIDLKHLKHPEVVTEDIRNILRKSEIDKRPQTLVESLKMLLQQHISIYTLYMGRNSFPLEYRLNNDVKTSPYQPSNKGEEYIKAEGAIPSDSIVEYTISEEETTEMFGEKLKRKEPTPFKLSIINRYPIAHSVQSDTTPAREISAYEHILLPSQKANMEVRPKHSASYSYHLEETAKNEEHLIICF